MKKSWFGVLCLLITTIIWGSAFVAQYMGSESLPPIAFTAARSFIGAMAVLPVALWSVRREKKAGVIRNPKALLLGGVACGTALALASTLQQAGVASTGAGKAGFLTVLYVVIVPIFGLFLKQRVGWPVWLSVGVALVGTYLLSINEAFTIEKGDLLILGCAVVYSVQILLVDHFVERANAVMLSVIQLATAGLITVVASLLFEQATFAQWVACIGPLLYVGVMSSGVAYTLQMVGQRFLQPTLATLLMSLESVFALLAGWVILGERLSGPEWIGCGLVLAAVTVAQFADKLVKEKQE
jgi:drug/metabolite transporter (DMT)-like permease